MKHAHDNAVRHAYNTLEEATRRLDSGKVRDPREHAMLISMIKDAKEITKNDNRMDNAHPYTDTNIGYGADVRRRKYADTDDLVYDAMDLVNRILPHVMDDDRYNVDDRRGVPSTGRRAVRRVRADRYDDARYDMDDDRYDDADDLRVVNMPRWRSARTGRFLPNLYGPSRVRRVRRSANMDDMLYDDDRYDRYDDDARYDDTQRTADDISRTAYETRRMTNEVRHAADEARRAADEARRTADDTRNVSPVMRAERGRYDDTRSDARSDRRYDTRTDNDTHRPGPDMR